MPVKLKDAHSFFSEEKINPDIVMLNVTYIQQKYIHLVIAERL